MLRETTAVALSSLLTLGPSASAWAAPSNGTVSGQVTVEGQPLQGLGLAVVDLKSGEIHRTKSDAKGNYRVRVQPGEYVVTSLSLAGLGVGRAPARVVVEAGRVVVASLELMKLPIVYQAQQPAQTPPASGPQTSGNITHEPVGCLVAGQFPLIEATIEPAASVARARVYFKSALGAAYYFVEMTLQPASASQMGGTKLASSQISGTLLASSQAAGATSGKFVGKLPKPKLEASPITYNIAWFMTDQTEGRTEDYQSQVVADESECPEGLKVAPIGPAGAVTVFSATTAAVAVPVGFAAGGLAIAGGTLAAVLLGAGAVAGGIAAGTGGTTTTTTTTIATTTTTTTSTTTTTTTTVPVRACEYEIANCTYNPVSEQPINCPCLPVGERCATRVVGLPCPLNFPNDKVTECCTTAITCSQIGQPTLPPPRNAPCDTSLPPVIVGK